MARIHSTAAETIRGPHSHSKQTEDVVLGKVLVVGLSRAKIAPKQWAYKLIMAGSSIADDRFARAVNIGALIGRTGLAVIADTQSEAQLGRLSIDWLFRASKCIVGRATELASIAEGSTSSMGTPNQYWLVLVEAWLRIAG